jgi:hypothetical protein
MKQKSKILFIIFLCSLNITSLKGQETIPATWGNVTGSGGSVSYTIGQVTYQMLSGTNGTVSQGVQQPYEISIVTAIDNMEGIILEYKVYPNPTRGLITLTIKPYDNENFRYRLYDLSGILFQDKKIESDETEISLESFTYSMYFLKVLKDNREVKNFKIIKR